MADHLRQHIEDRCHALRIALFRCPGRLFVHIAVGATDHPPQALQRPVKGLFPETVMEGFQRPVGFRQQGLVAFDKLTRLRHLSPAILVDHGQHALR